MGENTALPQSQGSCPGRLCHLMAMLFPSSPKLPSESHGLGTARPPDRPVLFANERTLWFLLCFTRLAKVMSFPGKVLEQDLQHPFPPAYTSVPQRHPCPPALPRVHCPMFQSWQAPTHPSTATSDSPASSDKLPAAAPGSLGSAQSGEDCILVPLGGPSAYLFLQDKPIPYGPEPGTARHLVLKEAHEKPASEPNR